MTANLNTKTIVTPSLTDEVVGTQSGALKRFELAAIKTLISPYTPQQISSNPTNAEIAAALIASGICTVGTTNQFIPTDLGSRLKLWYHFDQAYTFSDSGLTTRTLAGGTIYTLQALAGTNGQQATLANRPTLLEETGKFFGRFGASDHMQLVGTIAQTYPAYVYIAMRPYSVAANQLLFERTGSADAPQIYMAANNPFIYWQGGIQFASSLTNNTRYVMRYRLTPGTSVGIRLNSGSEESINTSANGAGVWNYLGDATGVAPITSDIEKIVIVQGAITTQEDSDIMAYLTSHTDTGALSGDSYEILHPLPGKITNPPIVIFCHGAGVDYTYPTSRTSPATALDCLAELRKAGYMVASANCGGNNWGNPASLTTLKAFYDYLVTTYSPSRVMFWGESMGGCLAQKAIADNRFAAVKGAYLTYPVCSIASMNAGYGSQISAAYPSGFTGASPIDLSGSAFSGKRLRYTHSASDTVVLKSSNTDAMRSIVGSYATESGLVVTSGEHGDGSNFVSADMLSFFGRCI